MVYSSIAERAAASERLIVDRILPMLSGVRPNRSKGGWSFFCPLEHRKKNAPAAIWVNDEGWIGIHCFDCRRNDELRQALVTPHLRGDSRPATVARPSISASPRAVPAPDYAVRVWAEATAIPRDCAHPARRWLANRNLWHPEMPVPPTLRWRQPGRMHTGSGSVAALLALPQAWLESWPGTPQPAAVQLVSVDESGRPALDRPAELGGLSKRTLGNATGAVLVIGNPLLVEATSPVRVVEGIADGLALASRYDTSVVVTAGTSGMRHMGIVEWLAGAESGVVIHADVDESSKGRAPAGTVAAGFLRSAIADAGGKVSAVYPPTGFKDAADAAKSEKFVPLDPGWVDYARTLAEITGWPRWEIARIAQIATRRKESEYAGRQSC